MRERERVALPQAPIERATCVRTCDCEGDGNQPMNDAPAAGGERPTERAHADGRGADHDFEVGAMLLEMQWQAAPAKHAAPPPSNGDPPPPAEGQAGGAHALEL